MPGKLQLSAKSTASLLAQIFGPAIYDAPLGGWDRGHLFDAISGPHPDPWRAGPWPDPWRKGPQPDPWRAEPWRIATALADAHVQELLSLDRAAAVLGGEAAQRALERSYSLVAEIDEICPRWPNWPLRWPPPPPPPPWWNVEMTAPELFMFGTRVLAASDRLEDGKLQAAVSGLGEKALGLSMKG
jgi:hypothetical protein